MKYIGKLYGKIENKYFDTGKTTEDWDKLESKESDLHDYKQALFSLKMDIEFDSDKQFEKMQNDIKFLYEMKSRAINAFENRDVSDKEMLYKMIEDWIDELSRKCDKL